ncbi:MAG: leucine-rich repeat protein, partial [Lachnospiraceae bacterium]|nr:leucine-rich repeat protein [Lachnospiraceae bacterium]
MTRKIKKTQTILCMILSLSMVAVLMPLEISAAGQKETGKTAEYADDAVTENSGETLSSEGASDRVKYEVEGGNIYYNPYTGFITGSDKEITSAEIPETIDGVTIKGIDTWAFSNASLLTSVTLPDTMESIEQGAFYHAGALTKITIPSKVTGIGASAFSGCSALKAVCLPADLETIGDFAFYECSALEYADIPGGVYKIGKMVFYGCSSLKGVYFVKDASIEIGTMAFTNCYKLEKVVNNPDARWDRFDRSLKRAVTYMNTDEMIESQREMWRIDSDEDGTKQEKETAIRTTAEELTQGCENDREKILAISKWIVKNIEYERGHGNDAWDVYSDIIANQATGAKRKASCGGYSNLTQVMLQSLGIPCATVWRCKKQGETIDHEYNLAYFEGKWRWLDTTASDEDSDDPAIVWMDAGTAGFAYHSDHRTDYLLYKADAASSIYVEIPTDIETSPDTKDWPAQDPEGAYVKKDNYTDPDWVHETSATDKAAEEEKIALRKAEFPDVAQTDASKFTFNSETGTITGVTDTSMTAISIPDTIDGVAVKTIGDKAFANCNKAVTIIMPDTVTELGSGAFSNCTSLQYVHLSEGITEIKGAVFKDDDFDYSEDTGDDIYVNPEGESIPGTFSGCSALRTVIIPENVSRLGGYIFSGCDKLEEILFENYAFKEKCIATDPRGSEDDYAAGDGNINWYAFKNVGRALYGLDFDESYKGTKWHKALQEVRLSDDWRDNILKVYDSQLDYREGFSPYYVGGMNTKSYVTPVRASYWEWGHFSEAGKFHGVDGTTWCYAFTQWNYAMAGIPLDHTGTSYTWDGLKYAGGTYTPQPGDIIGVGRTHVAMIGKVTENTDTVDIVIINGNHPNRNVGKELVRYDKASGKALSEYDEKNEKWDELDDSDSDDFRIRSVFCPAFDDVTAHALTLDPGEGEVSFDTRTVTEGGVYGALPDAYKNGYRFDGWYTAATGGEKVLPYKMFEKTTDQTLYAHYSEDAAAITSMNPVGENITVSVKGKRELTVILKPVPSEKVKLSWRSSDTDIVTVDSDGEIKGVAEGTAVIEARGPGGLGSVYFPVTVVSAKSGSQTDPEAGTYVIDGVEWTFNKTTGTILSVSSSWTGGMIPAEIDGVKVTAIGNGVGRSNQNVRFIMIPEGITSIGDNVFSSCHCLESLSLPSSLKSVGLASFSSCNQLADIDYAGDPDGISCERNAFTGALYEHPDFSDPYKGSEYYQKLMDVELTGDFVSDVMAIAESQKGYHEGDCFEELDGSNEDGDGEFCEQNYFKGCPEWLWHPESYGYYTWGGWCGIFCQWAYAMAGAPDEVMDVFAYKHQLQHTWDTTVYAGGSYELKKGDLIHFDYGHYAMVVDVDYDEENDKIDITTWNGNPDIALEVHSFTASSGLYDKTFGVRDYYVVWYVPVTPEAAEQVASYDITFDATLGTVDKASKKVYDDAYYGILPVPHKDGYVFDGWYTDKSGRGKKITPYSVVNLTGDATLYAKWKDADSKVWTDPDDSRACECDKSGRHTLVKTEAKEPGCEVDGNAAYYKCSVCNRYFASSTGKTELSEDDVIRKACHSLVKTDKKPATADEDGYEAYYTCSICGKMFSNAEGTNEITEPVVIPKGTQGGGGGNDSDEDDPSNYIVDENGYITKWNVYNVKIANIPEKVGDVTVKGIKDTSYAFGTRTALEKIIFPDTLTYIGKYAFWTCINLSELTIPDTVTYIGPYAFGVQKGREDESKLEKVTIGNGVTTIDTYAFFNCAALSEVTIGSGVTDIGANAFYGCSSLKEV